MITLVTVGFVGVEVGIGVAVGLALLDRTRRSARPHLYVLGKIPGTTSWAPLGHRDKPVPVPGIVVVQPIAALYYPNANHFHAEIHRALAAASTTGPADSTAAPKTLVLDADAMGDIDYTATRMLRALLDELEGDHIGFAVARGVGDVPHNLARSRLLERIGEHRLFDTVDQAVAALGPGASG